MARGQANTEALVVLILLLLLGIGGSSLMLKQLGKIILTKWAAKNSRCVAESDNSELCRLRTQHELRKYFAFREIGISEQIMYGVVHTKVRAKLLASQSPIESNFDLEPSEYKRVQK